MILRDQTSESEYNLGEFFPSVLISMSMGPLEELDYFKKSEVHTNCKVCNETINAYLSYGALVCASCRVFFRRHAHKESLKSCSSSIGQCDIKLFKRTFCNYCRLQKCLSVGMDPERIKKRKVFPDNQMKKKTLKLAIDLLGFIPKTRKSRPFPRVTSMRNLHSSMAFTIEEFLFCQKFQKTELLAWKSIPFPRINFEKIFLKNHTLSLKGFEELKQNSFERLIKFSNDLELLQALPLEDQFILQTINVKFLDLIRLADFFQPLYNRNQQANLLINGCPNHEEDIITKSSNFISRILMSQIMPWIDHQDQIYQMISQINDLQMDHLALLLVSIILLFNVPNHGLTTTKGITRVQDCLRLTLYRYLKCHNFETAQRKMSEIDHVLNNLINFDALW